jgi:hypothetical protein
MEGLDDGKSQEEVLKRGIARYSETWGGAENL